MRSAGGLELADDGIRVNAICPGTVDTPMVEHIMANAAKGGPDRVALHPLKRISTVEDQAAAASFLCSPEAGFITGVALSVDGGRHARKPRWWWLTSGFFLAREPDVGAVDNSLDTYFRDRSHEMSYVHERLSAGKFSQPAGVHSSVCMRWW
jgi:hypothetical protein